MTTYMIFCRGFQGTAYYTSREAAQDAADFRSRCMGVKWEVREIQISR